MLCLLGIHGKRDCRGYTVIYVPRGSSLRQFCNSGGWQYRHRLVVAVAIGRKLRQDEHVHHIDGDCTNDCPSNLELVLAEYHGSLEAFITTLGDGRGPDGRFRERDIPEHTRRTGRWLWLIGRSATAYGRNTPVTHIVHQAHYPLG